MRTLLVLSLALPTLAGCTKYAGATALQPGSDGSTWVYVSTNRERRTGVYHCTPPRAEGEPARCVRVVLDTPR